MICDCDDLTYGAEGYYCENCGHHVSDHFDGMCEHEES